MVNKTEGERENMIEGDRKREGREHKTGEKWDRERKVE
jgi:hypothetical protein